MGLPTGTLALPRRLKRFALLAFSLTFLFTWHFYERIQPVVLDFDTEYPLLSKHIKGGKVEGGAWHLPEEWTTEKADTSITTIVAAAQLALSASKSHPQRQIPYSTIPRIIHQTWKDTNPESWPGTFRDSAEKWLGAVEASNTAYLFWDDDGVTQFMRHFESDFQEEFYALPSNVERSDVFRVLVCKWIGGIYVDMDTEPLTAPSEWITEEDLIPWTDPDTGTLYNPSKSIQGIVGIEADCPPDTDGYWRAGYFFPVQLTQWSFAWAPGHPILELFIDRLRATMRDATKVAALNNQPLLPEASSQFDLRDIDPVNLTGPIAFTDSVRSWLDMKTDLRWNALSGLDDGGVSKVVEDILVLPITGFSPGRGRYANMGSKPITDPSARLYHHAEGSWRKISLKVEYGKVCRKLFGLCRDWSKVSHSNNHLW
ncbi:hypothetical protein BJX99DRAFT_272886 [Aspergillus californicus]